ncbi:hypothetical protein [Flavobacterium sp. 7A]|uniref:hypothetical protein n=1 Tax=Flavobacterium sp. 7A TaxID=2940571 RepID=UPI002225F01F|nr:hypothetical protein [Flavobacterium sp. 7A]MCW2118946.1 hypothetical protein [Flavobacterium sp. 7A]
MKSKLRSLSVPISVVLIIISSIAACNNKQKEYSSYKTEEVSTNPSRSLDFNNLTFLNQTNKKIIRLSSILFHQKKSVPHLQLILKVKDDHQHNERELKQLTKNNMMVIPRPFYELNLNKDSLHSKNSTNYLVRLLVKEIKIEINILETIQKTTTDPTFKSFAQKATVTLRQNNEDLGNSFKSYIL